MKPFVHLLAPAYRLADRVWLWRRRDRYALWGCRTRDCQIGSELDKLAQRIRRGLGR